MRKLFNEILCIAVAALCALIAFAIGCALADALAEQYTKSGGVVLASDLFGFKVIPIVFSIIGGVVGSYLQKITN